MTPDKFLTDLAALTGCIGVEISFWPKAINGPFDVDIWHIDCRATGTGPTVEAAMQEARARLAAHYEGEAA